MSISEGFYEKAAQICRDIKVSEPLARHTSMKVGGPCKVMLVPSTQAEIIELLRLCFQTKTDVYIMGNGTNLVFSDAGFDGVVIKTCGLSDILAEDLRFCCGSGALLSKVAAKAAKRGFSGLEFAAGIPGSVGGAVCMNAGAYGGEMALVTVKTVYADRSGVKGELVGDENCFSYRKSFYSTHPELTVLSAVFELKKSDESTIRAEMRELAERRKASQPLDLPSAGSAFKRPAGGYAAKLIEDAGLKGFSIGGAQVSEKHSGFIVNTGGAAAKEIKKLVKYIQKRVLDNSGILLEPEIKFVD